MGFGLEVGAPWAPGADSVSGFEGSIGCSPDDSTRFSSPETGLGFFSSTITDRVLRWAGRPPCWSLLGLFYPTTDNLSSHSTTSDTQCVFSNHGVLRSENLPLFTTPPCKWIQPRRCEELMKEGRRPDQAFSSYRPPAPGHPGTALAMVAEFSKPVKVSPWNRNHNPTSVVV